MYLAELGRTIRLGRQAKGLSQDALARIAGISRETLNRLERGSENDLGIKKINALLTALGIELSAGAFKVPEPPDFVQRAVATANVHTRSRLYGDELIQAFVTGQAPKGKEGHLQSVLEDLSPTNLDGLVAQVARLIGDADRVRRGLASLRDRLALH